MKKNDGTVARSKEYTRYSIKERLKPAISCMNLLHAQPHTFASCASRQFLSYYEKLYSLPSGKAAGCGALLLEISSILIFQIPTKRLSSGNIIGIIRIAVNINMQIADTYIKKSKDCYEVEYRMD